MTEMPDSCIIFVHFQESMNISERKGTSAILTVHCPSFMPFSSQRGTLNITFSYHFPELEAGNNHSNKQYYVRLYLYYLEFLYLCICVIKMYACLFIFLLIV